MKKIIQNTMLGFLSLVIILQNNIAGARSNLTVAGDITQIVVPLGALGISLYKEDKEGQKEFAKSFVANIATVFALKYAFKNSEWGERPNGGSYSFPSGHTAAAASGAFFLNTRYGKEYGIPAIALAGFTGYTRVKGKYHHWRDVIGGAVVAFGANYLFVNKLDDQAKVTTNLSNKSAVVAVDMPL